MELPWSRTWSASLRIDGRGHGETDAQGMGGQFLGLKRDAHRNALHHLDPVAGGVLRRDDRKGRAGAAAHAGNLAVIDDLAAIQVGGQRHLLADAYIAE